MTYKIFLKELKALMKNRRLIFNLFILPPLLLFSLMQLSVKTETKNALKHNNIYAVIDSTDSTIVRILQEEGISVQFIEPFMVDSLQKEGLILKGIKGDYTVYYYPSNNKTIINRIKEAIYNANIKYFKNTLKKAPPYNIDFQNMGGIVYELRNALSSFIPLIILIYLVSGSSAVGMDTFAGEKERHTLSLLLTQPIKPISIFMGKMLYTILIAIIYTIVISFSISYPFFKMFNNIGNIAFSVQDIFPIQSMIAFVALTFSLTIFVAATILTISLFVKSVKEGQTMIIFLIVLPILGKAFTNNPQIKYIPFINGIWAMTSIITGNMSINNILLASSANIIGAILLVILSLWLFSKESIVFRN